MEKSAEVFKRGQNVNSLKEVLIIRMKLLELQMSCEKKIGNFV